MATIDDLGDSLRLRDAIEQKLVPYFDAFTVASQRAIRNEKAASMVCGQNRVAGVESNADCRAQDTIQVSADHELIARLQQSRKNLEDRLDLLQSQLDQAQERARAMSEVEYLKTHAVQGLHDEILALTMQLNLSEEKRKKLQNDLGR